MQIFQDGPSLHDRHMYVCMQGYLTFNGRVNLPRVQMILTGMGSIDVGGVAVGVAY